MWHSAVVLKGSRDGHTIGFPTVNLDPAIIPNDTKHGVYAATVRYENKTYKAALFYGSRLVKNETNTKLEIYLIDFDKEIYDQTIEFQVGSFIRDNMNFSSMEQLKMQIEKDIRIILSLPSNK